MSMKTKIIKTALALVAVLASGTALAYEEETQKEYCKKPKYYDFSLPLYKEPEKIEVPPESEFEFKLSVWSDPEGIKLTARNENLPFTVESNSSFHLVKSKLLPGFTGKFVRINARVKAVLGCHEQFGWLVKVADIKLQEAAPAPEAEAPTTESAETTPENKNASESAPSAITPPTVP